MNIKTSPFFLLLGIALILGGCQNESKMKGEVFVVTNGGENIQLGDVRVRAIKSKKMKKHLQEKYESSLINLREKLPLVDSLERVRTELEKRREELEKIKSSGTPVGTNPDKLYALPDALLYETPYGETITGIEPGTEIEPISREGTNYKVSYRDKTGYVPDVSVVSGERYDGPLGNALDEYSSTFKRCESIRDSVMSPLVPTSDEQGFRISWVVDGLPQDYYFQNTPKAKDKDRTNSEGEFELTLEEGVSYHILASDSRLVGNSREKYYWMVEKIMQGENGEVVLSNSNLNEALPDSLDPVANSSLDLESVNHKLCDASY